MQLKSTQEKSRILKCCVEDFLAKLLAWQENGSDLKTHEARYFMKLLGLQEKKRPQYLFLENVKGLLSHDNGKTFTTILSTLDELGYDAEWQVINSKYFIPQSRERVFIIGHIREKPIRKIFPIIEDAGLSQGEQTTPNVRTITGGGHSGGLHSQMTLIYLSQKNMNMKQRIQERNESWTLTGNGNDFGVVTNTVRSGGHGSLDRHSWDVLKHDKRIRRLTPLECERLHGFPDNYTKGISDTQRYKCLGNAVTVPVVEYIVKNLHSSP